MSDQPHGTPPYPGDTGPTYPGYGGQPYPGGQQPYPVSPDEALWDDEDNRRAVCLVIKPGFCDMTSSVQDAIDQGGCTRPPTRLAASRSRRILGDPMPRPRRHGAR